MESSETTTTEVRATVPGRLVRALKRMRADSSRPILAGLNYRPDTGYLEATNGHVLGRFRVDVWGHKDAAGTVAPVWVPPALLDAVRRNAQTLEIHPDGASVDGASSDRGAEIGPWPNTDQLFVTPRYDSTGVEPIRLAPAYLRALADAADACGARTVAITPNPNRDRAHTWHLERVGTASQPGIEAYGLVMPMTAPE